MFFSRNQAQVSIPAGQRAIISSVKVHLPLTLLLHTAEQCPVVVSLHLTNNSVLENKHPFVFEDLFF